MHIGEYITYRRERMGYTKQKLADILSVSKQAVYKWENNLSTPDIMILPQLAAALRTSPRLLVEIIWLGDGEMNITHFTHLTVTEKNGEHYVIATYESQDFLPLANYYDGICTGKDETILERLSEYYKFDSSRTVSIELTAAKYDADYAIPKSSLLIEQFRLNPVIEDYINRKMLI